MEDVAIDFVFVNSLGQEEGYYLIDFRVGRIVGEAARVGHHACVEAGGGCRGHSFESSELVDESEDNLTG